MRLTASECSRSLAPVRPLIISPFRATRVTTIITQTRLPHPTHPFDCFSICAMHRQRAPGELREELRSSLLFFLRLLIRSRRRGGMESQTCCIVAKKTSHAPLHPNADGAHTHTRTHRCGMMPFETSRSSRIPHSMLDYGEQSTATKATKNGSTVFRQCFA